MLGGSSREAAMPFYLIEAAYKDSAARALIANPQKRSDVVKKTCESLGGSLQSLFFAFGDYDVVALVELPDNKAAAALALGIGASGALSKYRTTVLMTQDEAMEAMRRAGDISYIPPQ
jgi:uncharacterized protein with GYD domain